MSFYSYFCFSFFPRQQVTTANSYAMPASILFRSASPWDHVRGITCEHSLHLQSHESRVLKPRPSYCTERLSWFSPHVSCFTFHFLLFVYFPSLLVTLLFYLCCHPGSLCLPDLLVSLCSLLPAFVTASDYQRLRFVFLTTCLGILHMGPFLPNCNSCVCFFFIQNILILNV